MAAQKPPPVTGKEHVKIARLEPVGNYAVRIVFDDGHDSGLYSWDFLAGAGTQGAHERGDTAAEANAGSALPRAPLRQRVAIIKGQDSGRFMDFYHFVLTVSWPVFILQLADAVPDRQPDLRLLLCWRTRPASSNARPGSFADAFFFSVQTLGTLGYGAWRRARLYVNLLVTAESFTGILIIALFTGIIFARFSRPFARVLFSNVAVVALFDGVPTLMFRAANQRGEFHSGCLGHRVAGAPAHHHGRRRPCAASRN